MAMDGKTLDRLRALRTSPTGHPQDRQHAHGDACEDPTCTGCACCNDHGPDCG